MLSAQMSPNLTVAPLETVKAAKNTTVTVTVKAHLPSGYHANSNKPTEAYLIPLTLTWEKGPLTVEKIAYPAGSMEKYSFSEKPLSVVTGDFSIATTFKVAPGTANGPAGQTGILKYQACDDHACYPPKKVPVNLTVSVE
jgi:hypothetical protein